MENVVKHRCPGLSLGVLNQNLQPLGLEFYILYCLKNNNLANYVFNIENYKKDGP